MTLPSPPFPFPRYVAPPPFDFNPQPRAHPRLSPSPLIQPPFNQPYSQETEMDAEDDGSEAPEDVDTPEITFEKLYGQGMWTRFDNEAPAMVVPDMSRADGSKAQVAIKLFADVSEYEGVGADEESMDGRGEGGKGYQIIIEVVSGPTERKGWKVRSFSHFLPSSPSDDQEELAYSVPRLHSYIQKYGFNIAEEGEGQNGSAVLHILADRPNGKDTSRVLPLHFRRAESTNLDPEISTAFCDYLLEKQKQEMMSQAQRRDDLERERAQGDQTGKKVPIEGMTLRQRGEMLDRRAAELRDNVPRFKRKMAAEAEA